MIRGISKAIDAHGVTHYLQGHLRFVRAAKKKRRHNPGGHYITKFDCRWWCTSVPIPVYSSVTRGKEVDCMACLIRPPEEIMINIPKTPGKSTSLFEGKRQKIWIRGRRR